MVKNEAPELVWERFPGNSVGGTATTVGLEAQGWLAPGASMLRRPNAHAALGFDEAAGAFQGADACSSTRWMAPRPARTAITSTTRRRRRGRGRHGRVHRFGRDAPADGAARLPRRGRRSGPLRPGTYGKTLTFTLASPRLRARSAPRSAR